MQEELKQSTPYPDTEIKACRELTLNELFQRQAQECMKAAVVWQELADKMNDTNLSYEARQMLRRMYHRSVQH